MASTGAPRTAWAAPLAAILADVGAATPWFRPEVSGHGRTATFDHTLYSWRDGRLGLLAPVLLTVAAIGVVGVLVGRSPARFNRGSRGPAFSAGVALTAAGAISVACVLGAWSLATSQFTFASGRDWSAERAFAASEGLSLSRGPQLGWYLTAAAAAVAFLAGASILVLDRLAARVGRSTAGDGWQDGAP